MGTEGHADVVGFEEVDASQVAAVGGKGASLGELSRIDGVRVPPGFCVTTHAFRRVVGDLPALELLDRLDVGDREAIRALSAQVRDAVEGIALPTDLADAIRTRLKAGAPTRSGRARRRRTRRPRRSPASTTAT